MTCCFNVSAIAAPLGADSMFEISGWIYFVRIRYKGASIFEVVTLGQISSSADDSQHPNCEVPHNAAAIHFYTTILFQEISPAG